MNLEEIILTWAQNKAALKALSERVQIKNNWNRCNQHMKIEKK